MWLHCKWPSVATMRGNPYFVLYSLQQPSLLLGFSLSFSDG